MSRRITISVPDDVAETLDQQSNVSAYIADAVRRRTDRERHDLTMRAVGMDPELLRTPGVKARIRPLLHVTAAQAASRRELGERLGAGERVPMRESH